MTAAHTRVEEIRAAVRGRDRTDAPAWSADPAGDISHVAPISPDGHRECWGVQRPGATGWAWLIGWIGSPFTISIDLDSGRFLWTQHVPSLRSGTVPLTREMLGHLHQPFAGLPADVRS